MNWQISDATEPVSSAVLLSYRSKQEVSHVTLYARLSNEPANDSQSKKTGHEKVVESLVHAETTSIVYSVTTKTVNA